MSASDFELGQKAKLNADDTIGTVRYIGPIHVATGDFIGLELSGPTGKNDGSVQGRRYFTCEPKRGIFVKPSAAKPFIVPSTSPIPVLKKALRNLMVPPVATTSKKPVTSRLSMAPPLKRQSITPAAARLSILGKQQQLGGPSGKITPAAESQQQQLGRPSVNFDVENEELRARLSVLESRRDEREGLLAAAVADKEKYAGLVQKLEAKLKPLAEELQELRAEAQELKKSQREARNAEEEYETTLESLTLDRELALENNDKLKVEVLELKFKVDELELQNEIYREEKVLEKASSEDEHNPHDITYLQVENARMREALLRLRDITTSDKVDLESQILLLQEDVLELPDVKKENEVLQQDLIKAQDVIEHQKGQIESSEDNETLIMDMQTKLQANHDKINELEAFIETSNESEEINEKIISNLEEAQRGTQAELDHQKALIQAATERIIAYERTVADQDDTVEKYRKLTSTLQSTLREAQGSHQTSQQEKAIAEKRAQNLQDLAKETQRSTARAQRREYEHDVTKLRLNLAQKELGIVKTYLPDNYKIVNNSTQSLLTLKSINGKLQILKLLLRNEADEPFTTDHNINKLIRPKLISQLGYLDLLTEQLDEYFPKASLPAFIKLGELNYELHSMDKAVDTWIDGLFKDSLVETDIMKQTRMYVNFLDNVTEEYMPGNPQSTGSSPDCALDYGRQLSHIEHDLDSVRIFLHYLKEMFIKYLNIDFEADELDRDQYKEHEGALIKILNTMHNLHAREKRTQERWVELKDRNMTIDNSIEEKIYLCRQSLAEAFDIAYENTLDFSKLVSEEREHELTILDLRPVVGNVPYELLTDKITESYKHINAAKDLMDNTDCLNEVLEESVQHPWIIHNITLKNEEIDVQEVIQQLSTTKTELTERNTTNALNKKMIEELNVSIEVLNKRINDSGAKNDRVIELEKALNASSSKADTLTQKVDILEEKLKQASTEKQRDVVDTPTFSSKIPVPIPASRDITILRRQVANLESTVRDIHIAKRQQITVDFEQLQPERENTETEELSERAARNMKAAMDKLAFEKRENRKKKTSTVKRKLTADQALNSFRKALRH